MEDIEVRQVIVNDDVAVEDSTFTAGRRGVACTFLVEKITGAAAERGLSLDEVERVAQSAIKNVRSMGVALTSCTVPYVGKPSFDLDDNEIELGVGIHGEPGRRRAPMSSADEITDQLLDPIVADLELKKSDRVIALVNGMGGTPLSELYIVFRRVAQRLSDLGVTLERSDVGNFVTSLEMQGVSITLLRVDDELLSLYDDPAETPAFVKK